MKHKHTQTLWLLFIVLTVLVIIFKDAYFSQHKTSPQEDIPQKSDVVVTQYEATKEDNTTTWQTSIEASKNLEDILSQKITNKNIEDLKTLQKIYEEKKSLDILEKIVQKQVQNYQFNDAIKNIATILDQWWSIDPNLHLHAYINSNYISINKPESIKSILPIVERYIDEKKLNQYDYNFYQGLIELRNKKYSAALELRKSNTNPVYTTTIQTFEKAIHSYNAAKAIPPYYQDGLVALAAMKNWYFTIARKIALETAFKDEKYILPYQVLAYAHFLTNNRDTAIEYFLKLADFDKNNKSLYQFLIGVSYYRQHDYDSSVLYISQVNTPKLETDKLRYLILDYTEMQNNTKINLTRQKLLGQKDINQSDFYSYFYNTFYKAYFSQDKSLYNENPQLAILFSQKCNEVIWINNSICLYGEIGKNFLEGKWGKSETDLINLANTYKQSYLYHMLGDYYTSKTDKQSAKENYAKALSLTNDANEEMILKEKLSTI